ncbi:hypothetical protein [Clostridium sp.]|uniref:hypothetical protein n=3 Tax=Clostridium sp. TaxID=1506 RepID=UPI002FC649D7
MNKLPNCNNNIFLYNYIGLKHLQFPESFKGQKVPPISITNERRQKVFVSVILNEKSMSFSKIVSKGILFQSMCIDMLKKKLKFNSNIIGFCDRYSTAIARRLNKDLRRFKECPLDSQLNLKDLLQNFSSLLRVWLGIFRGVATKYLDAYLDWFIHVFENSFNNKVMTSNLINAIFCN